MKDLFVTKFFAGLKHNNTKSNQKRNKKPQNNTKLDNIDILSHFYSPILFTYRAKSHKTTIKAISNEKEPKQAIKNSIVLKFLKFIKIYAIEAKNAVKRMLKAFFKTDINSFTFSFIKIILTQKYKISKGLR